MDAPSHEDYVPAFKYSNPIRDYHSEGESVHEPTVLPQNEYVNPDSHFLAIYGHRRLLLHKIHQIPTSAVDPSVPGVLPVEIGSFGTPETDLSVFTTISCLEPCDDFLTLAWVERTPNGIDWSLWMLSKDPTCRSSGTEMPLPVNLRKVGDTDAGNVILCAVAARLFVNSDDGHVHILDYLDPLE